MIQIVLLVAFIGTLVIILGGLHREGVREVRKATYPFRRPRW